MSKTITIKIDKRSVTLTANDVAVLVKIARDIDRVGSITWADDASQGHVEIHRKQLQRLGKWLDTHGPEATEWAASD